MSSDLTIRAKLIEEVSEEGIGVPKGVHITGAGFLDPFTLLDIAQEVLDSYSGDYRRDYIGVLPDRELVTDNMTIKVIKQQF